MFKGEGQVKKSKAQSTDAWCGGGPVCSSVEFTVMVKEPRNLIVPVETCVNFARRISI